MILASLSLTPKKKEEFRITLAGKRIDSTFQLTINYPYGSANISLNGQIGHVLQNPYGEDKRTIKTNTSNAIALYFGGYKQGNGTFYCLAKTAKPEEMYEAFQVEDYYVFYLTIKD